MVEAVEKAKDAVELEFERLIPAGVHSDPKKQAVAAKQIGELLRSIPDSVRRERAEVEQTDSFMHLHIGFDATGFNSDANNGGLVGPGQLGTKDAAGGSPLTELLNTTCQNLACHNPDNAFTTKLSAAADETANEPAWGDTITTCTTCHGVNANGDPANENHGIHDSAYACEACHNDVDVDAAPPGRVSHGNLVLNVDQVDFGTTLGSVDLSGGNYTVSHVVPPV